MRRLQAGIRDYTRLLDGFGTYLLPDTSQAYQARMLSTENAEEEKSSSPASSWAGAAFAFEGVRLVGVNTTGATVFVVAGVEPIFPWTTGVGSSGSIVSASSGIFTVSVAIIPNIAPERKIPGCVFFTLGLALNQDGDHEPHAIRGVDKGEARRRLRF